MKTNLVFLFILSSLLANAQDALTLQDAIAKVLKNNYSILIEKNMLEIANNNNSLGNAGMLPTVSVNAGANQTVSNINQQFTDGRTIQSNNVGSQTTSAGVSLNWTLFDGLKMFATKNKLSEIEAKGELVFKIEMEQSIQQVIAAYFDVVQQQKIIEAIRFNIAIDSERVALAQTRLNIGSGSSLELLQAKVDGNEQRAALLKQLASLQESKENLSYLLSQKVSTTFIATDTIKILYAIPNETLATSVQQKNYSLLAAQQDEKISMQILKEVKALRMPTVNFTTGYNYSKNKSDAGFMLFNQNTGYNYGLSLKWNVFDGFNTSRQIKNAELNYRSAGLYYNDLQLQVNVQVQKAMRDFSNALALLQLEQENSLLANENLTVAFERFRSGLSNSLELKAAQLSYQNSLTRLIQTQYAAKLAETELMRLNGELVK